MNEPVAGGIAVVAGFIAAFFGIGGGPIGVELAQAHRRLGARVTVVEMFSLLNNDDPELVDVVRNRLRAEGVNIPEGVAVARLAPRANGLPVPVS